jgi:hypothetical protein
LIGEGGTAVVRLLDASQLPIPYHIALNRSITPQLYRMRASNVGPPLRQFKVTWLGRAVLCLLLWCIRAADRELSPPFKGMVDSEGKGLPITFHLLAQHGVACTTSSLVNNNNNNMNKDDAKDINIRNKANGNSLNNMNKISQPVVNLR